MKPIFQGVGVALVTPFHPDGSVNYEKLKDLLEFQVENHTDAIIICGTTGETPTLTDEEYKKIIAFTVKTIHHRIPVIAGAGSNCTEKSISQSILCQDLGVDGLLHATPYYNKPTQTGLVAHFSAIASKVSLPIILYNVPSRTGISFTPQTYKILSKLPNIIGTKEASGDLSLVAKTKALCGDSFQIFSGNDDQILPVLSLGGEGVISVVANLLPTETRTICTQFFQNNIKESRNQQLALLDLLELLFIETNPIPIKAAMNLSGMNVGNTRLPLSAMEEEHGKKLALCLAKLKQ